MGVPVYEALAAVDVAVLEHAEEGFAHGLRTHVVERETGPFPVAGGAHFSKLAEDAGLVLVFPLPDALHEFVAAEVVASLLFLGEDELFHHGLRADAGVIGAGHPQGVVALHAPPADEHVLQRVVECVAHMKGAGHVRRRDDDRVRLAVGVGRTVEVAAFFPERKPLGLGFLGVVSFRQFSHRRNPKSQPQRHRGTEKTRTEICSKPNSVFVFSVSLCLCG